MSKKANLKIVISLVAALVLIVGGFFWWQETSDVYRYNNPENFIISDFQQRKIVENEKAGLRVETIDDWTADIWILAGEGVPTFFSPDSKFYENNNFEKGIWIFIEILNCDKKNPYIRPQVECEETHRILKELLEDPSGTKEVDSYKIREFDGFTGIQMIDLREIDDNRMLEHISIKIPIGGKLYYINGVLIPPDEEKYSRFEDFLRGVTIK